MLIILAVFYSCCVLRHRWWTTQLELPRDQHVCNDVIRHATGALLTIASTCARADHTSLHCRARWPSCTRACVYLLFSFLYCFCVVLPVHRFVVRCGEVTRQWRSAAAAHAHRKTRPWSVRNHSEFGKVRLTCVLTFAHHVCCPTHPTVVHSMSVVWLSAPQSTCSWLSYSNTIEFFLDLGVHTTQLLIVKNRQRSVVRSSMSFMFPFGFIQKKRVSRRRDLRRSAPSK